jgi:predicted RNA-binding protein (TIGR00451 family)
LILQKIRSIADYQFGKGLGKKLFSDTVQVSLSKRTGRIRHIFQNGTLLATLRAQDGYFSLTIAGAKKLWKKMEIPKYWVRIQNEAAPFVAEGKNVFSKHIIDADEDIRPHEEVIILDELENVIGVGKSRLNGKEMKAFKIGVGVKVRRGVKEEN